MTPIQSWTLGVSAVVGLVGLALVRIVIAVDWYDKRRGRAPLAPLPKPAAPYTVTITRLNGGDYRWGVNVRDTEDDGIIMLPLRHGTANTYDAALKAARHAIEVHHASQPAETVEIPMEAPDA